MSTMTQATPSNGLASLIESGREALNRIPLSLPQLLARLAVANVFWRSGQTKLASWDTTVQLFQNEYHVPILPPDIAATLAASFELGCSTLLVFGFFTRLATLPLLGMTFVIQTFVYPSNWPDHLLWASLLVFLLARGPGVFSLDYVVGRFFERRNVLR